MLKVTWLSSQPSQLPSGRSSLIMFNVCTKRERRPVSGWTRTSGCRKPSVLSPSHGSTPTEEEEEGEEGGGGAHPSLAPG